MNTLLYGRYGKFPEEISHLVEQIGLVLVEHNPELVITFGGDGTLIGAERDFPGVLKLPLKDSRICHRCVPLTPEQTLEAFSKNKLALQNFLKLEAVVAGKTLLALNDIVIRNTTPNIALRFDVQAGGNDFPGLIGDGLVVATPFGSSGYYHSITKQEFTSGIGLAFNNICDRTTPLFVAVNTTDLVTVTITRGPGTLTIDNSPELTTLSEDTRIEIAASQQVAKIYTLPTP